MHTPVTCPALLIAAPASGQGKTTVTAALARLHTRQGRRVRVFKCGPDFLDPFWHELASGAPVHNVDLWLTGEDDIRTRLHAAAAEADLILIEGVMGLYDGTPSAADIARLLDVPVLLVADASAVAQTFGAVVQGLRCFAPHWDQPAAPPLRWAGVLANRVGSERHAQMLADAVTASTPPSPATVGQGWLGALPRQTAFSLPERHLGLVAAHELPDALSRLDALADALAATPLGQMDSAALHQHWAVRFTPPAPHTTPTPHLQGQTIAVARDAAFCFIHTANLDTLQQLGAKVVFFSPLADAELPTCDAVWLPGGYPELHAATLQANVRLRAALQSHVAMGRPIWAECGGMMLLFDQLTDKAGQTHAMWGLLPGTVAMQQRLVALGPQQLRDLGTPALRGHTFHWSRVETPLKPFARTCGPHATPQAVGEGGEALYVHGPIRASYFHAWFASAPEVIATLLRPQPLRCVPPS
jgi:cobyrinic acid a,c-diamide synthase